MRLWIDFQSQNLVLLILIFVLSFILALLSYRYTLPPLSIKKKTFLLFLRWLALLCLFLAIAETLLGISQRTWEGPKIALLLDSSRSMNIKDKMLTRREVLQELLEEKSFKELLSKAEVFPYLFSESLIPYDFSEEILPFEGEVTSIGNSLDDLRTDLRGEELSAVILISDGVSNKGKDPTDIAKSYATPVYPIGIGEFVPVKDISLEKLEYEEISYSGEKDTIIVTIKNQGFEGIKIPVILLEGEKILARKELQFNFSGEAQEIELIFEPGVEGIHNYQVIIPKIEGESFHQNNQRNLTQKVLKRRFKLFLVSQSLNWEHTFLKRFLTRSKDITFESLVLTNSARRNSSELNLSRRLEEYDLFILLDSPQFLVLNQKEIRDILQKKGASLLILVGEKFYEKGDLSGILDFLPFQLKKESKPQYLNFNLTLTPEGRLHPVTRLSDDSEENSYLWANLPPFERLVPLKEKNEAKVLAFSKKGTIALPGIILKELEKGKIEVLSISPLWKWDFLSWGIGKDNSAYKKFWENSFRWLLAREDLERFKVKTDKEVYKRGEEIKFTSRLLDESYQQINGAEISIKIIPKEKMRDSLSFNLFPEESGVYSYTLSSSSPGEYLFQGEARKESFILGVSRGKFKVEKISLEDEELKPDKELLREIAYLSGGEYYNPEDFSLLLENLDLEKKSKLKMREIPLWDQPLLLLFFIIFLSLEWFFRKRFQLL